jgi:sRNA-binding carbon storage regulator CsrA
MGNLVLTRRSGQRLVFVDRRTGEETVLTVVRLTPSTVRLGIDAPAGVNVLREELLARSGHEGQSEGSPGHDASMATDGP